MASIGQRLANTRHFMNTNIIANRFHTSPSRQLIQEWRRKNRLTANPNAFGPLTNLPDYSYVDGRPAPFGVRQWGRIIKQREILTKVRKLVGELDYAVARHECLRAQNAEDRRIIMEEKLKPKGQHLLSESNTKELE